MTDSNGSSGAGSASARGAVGGVPLFELRDVVREYPVKGQALRRSRERVHAVSGVSFQIGEGETFGLVGESGCGKSTIARMAVGLERPSSGTILFRGERLSEQRGKRLRDTQKGLEIVFQDPFSSLDPKMSIARVVAEPLVIQGGMDRHERRRRVEEVLLEVGLPTAAVDRYPHELSGGQRQRVALARAIILRPRFIVADEPTSALDVSVRAQILNLMMDLQDREGLTYLVSAHDLAAIRQISHRIGVMYLGKLVETGPSEDVIARPAHPYTARLLAAVPEINLKRDQSKGTIRNADELPSPLHPPSGCRFRTRCPRAQDLCATVEPEMSHFGGGQLAACHFPLRVPIETQSENVL